MNQIERVLFVYENKDTREIRVRWHDDHDLVALDKDQTWKHIGTLEPKTYVNSMLSKCSALVSHMKQEPFGDEFQLVLNENMDDLYES